jgi:CTP:molybdopterin cytidylyltransferase MocA
LSIEPLTEKSALVVLAHDPKIDDVALSVGLRSPAFYLGVLGSRGSHAKRLTRLEAQGFSRRELMRLHGPVGLAIGAQSPEEIAVAIVAEIVKTTRRPKPRIGGIIMAAGSSKRMGNNKLAMMLNGRPLVRHVVESALASRLEPIIVVTGHEKSAIEEALRGSDVTFVHNPDFEVGLSTSLRTGLDALPQHCEAAMVLLGDMPGITSSLIESVASLYNPGAGRLICAASAMGRIGHPILWDCGFFDELTAVSGDIGARDVLQKHVEKIFTAPADPNALQDIDTVAELERAQVPHAVGS